LFSQVARGSAFPAGANMGGEFRCDAAKLLARGEQVLEMSFERGTGQVFPAFANIEAI
jgi:hypothetical protein